MSNYVQAQKLNRRITIQRKTQCQDAAGQLLDIWVDVCKAWAHIKTITGSGFMNQEFIGGGIEVSRATASIRIRRRSGLDAGMRVLYGPYIYEIRVVLPDLQDNRFIDLGCATGANEG